MTDFETHPIGTAKRIEGLEAKLAKAVRALQFIACDENVEGRHAIFTLAELEGKPHGED